MTVSKPDWSHGNSIGEAYHKGVPIVGGSLESPLTQPAPQDSSESQDSDFSRAEEELLEEKDSPRT